ncbi:MAG TPA: methylmalonyl-CoA mutase family protein, partial [Fusibacter sp.]|nr:methylmalonyl-CoA mutase family protein [Fusibacter sp.]
MAYIKKIDDIGGAAKAIDAGYIQSEIMDASYDYQKKVETGEIIVVGMNKYQIEEASPKGLLRVDPSVGEMQKARLAKLRASRDNVKVNETLAALKTACEGTDNVMPFILEAVKTYATLGEICDVMRGVFGEYQQSINL